MPDDAPEGRARAPRPRWFGRGRTTWRWRAQEVLLRLACAGGWPATLAHALHLQGRVRCVPHTFRLRGRRASAPPLRVAFASDFHAGPTTHPSLLAAACAELARARPDVLLLGGDFVSLHAGYVDPLVDALATIPAPLGRFAVMGNHDLVADDAYIARRLEAIGIEVLVNRSVRLAPPHDDLWICGLDDPTRGDADGEATLAGAEGTRLVLMHSPDGLLALAGQAFDLAFCGHTHGGQVALPGGRALVVPEGLLSRRFLHGLFRVPTPLDAPDARLLVSRGVGCSGVPVRLFAPPEVHVCEIAGTGE